MLVQGGKQGSVRVLCAGVAARAAKAQWAHRRLGACSVVAAALRGVPGASSLVLTAVNAVARHAQSLRPPPT